MGLISCKLQGRVFLKISHVNLLSKNEVFLSTVESYFGVVLHHVIECPYQRGQVNERRMNERCDV
jgi:hypothetical protein